MVSSKSSTLAQGWREFAGQAAPKDLARAALDLHERLFAQIEAAQPVAVDHPRVEPHLEREVQPNVSEGRVTIQHRIRERMLSLGKILAYPQQVFLALRVQG